MDILAVRSRVLLENIRVADQWVRENCPLDQPYLYTPKGDPIVFRKRAGFETPMGEDQNAAGDLPAAPEGGASHQE